jgi:hypothetical protein
MDKQTQREAARQIEDLPVEAEQADEVKGGRFDPYKNFRTDSSSGARFDPYK